MRYIIVNGVESKYYKCDRLGNIYNIEGKRLTYHRTWNGYERVRLQRDLPRRMYLVHRIVAETFLLNTEGYPIVNHINEDRADNRIINLEWCNNSINQRQRFKKRRGTKSKPVLQYSLDGGFIKEWETPKAVYESLGIQAQNISKVCRGERDSSGGFKWEYK